MKKILLSIIKKMKGQETATPLGRWNIDYCKNKINRKIELSNEDHCGTCGQYINSKFNASARGLYKKSITNIE